MNNHICFSFHILFNRSSRGSARGPRGGGLKCFLAPSWIWRKNEKKTERKQNGKEKGRSEEGRSETTRPASPPSRPLHPPLPQINDCMVTVLNGSFQKEIDVGPGLANSNWKHLRTRETVYSFIPNQINQTIQTQIMEWNAYQSWRSVIRSRE